MYDYYAISETLFHWQSQNYPCYVVRVKKSAGMRHQNPKRNRIEVRNNQAFLIICTPCKTACLPGGRRARKRLCKN